MWTLTNESPIHAVNVSLDTRSDEPESIDEALRQMEASIDIQLTVPTGIWPLRGMDKLLLACRSAFASRTPVQERCEFDECSLDGLVVEEYASYTEDDTNAMLRQLHGYLERLALGNSVDLIERPLWGNMQEGNWPELSVASWIVFRTTGTLQSGDSVSIQLAWEDHHFNGESRFSNKENRHFDLREFLQFLMATIYAREPELQQQLAAPSSSTVIYDWNSESDAVRRPFRSIAWGPDFTGNVRWPTRLHITRGSRADDALDFLNLHELLSEFMFAVQRTCEDQRL